MTYKVATCAICIRTVCISVEWNISIHHTDVSKSLVPRSSFWPSAAPNRTRDPWNQNIVLHLMHQWHRSSVINSLPKRTFESNTVFTSQIINMYLTIMHPSSSKLLVASSVTVNKLSLTSNSVNKTILLYLGVLFYYFFFLLSVALNNYLSIPFFSNQPRLAPTTTNHNIC